MVRLALVNVEASALPRWCRQGFLPRPSDGRVDAAAVPGDSALFAPVAASPGKHQRHGDQTQKRRQGFFIAIGGEELDDAGKLFRQAGIGGDFGGPTVAGNCFTGILALTARCAKTVKRCWDAEQNRGL